MEAKNKYERIAEFNMLENQLRQIEQQIALIDQQITHQNEVSQNIGDLKKISKGTESFLPLAEDIFVKTKIVDNENLLINVGGKTILKKSNEEVKVIIQKQIGKLNSLRREFGLEIDQILQELLRIEKEIKS